MTDRDRKLDTARRIVTEAGAPALNHVSDRETLRIDRKGVQDFVSQADREVDRAVRKALARACPDEASSARKRRRHPAHPAASG